MGFFTKLKKFCGNLLKSKHDSVKLVVADRDLKSRMDRLERNYIILLKRVLEIDGVQMITKTSAFTNKILRTPNDEIGNGLINEPEPTIH